MTREEFESILEEAFLEGYNNAYEEIEEALDEDDNYVDIEDYDAYDESKNVRKRISELDKEVDGNGTTYIPKYPSRDWTKFADRSTQNGLGGRMRLFHLGDRNHKVYGYQVYNRAPWRYKSNAVGRIKSGANDSDDPRSEKLKELVRRNREKYLKKEMPPVFKNKGNKY